jgi:hypothetical protein
MACLIILLIILLITLVIGLRMEPTMEVGRSHTCSVITQQVY